MIDVSPWQPLTKAFNFSNEKNLSVSEFGIITPHHYWGEAKLSLKPGVTAPDQFLARLSRSVTDGYLLEVSFSARYWEHDELSSRDSPVLEVRLSWLKALYFEYELDSPDPELRGIPPQEPPSAYGTFLVEYDETGFAYEAAKKWVNKIRTKEVELIN